MEALKLTHDPDRFDRDVPRREKVYRHLKDNIISLVYSPGDIINERTVADELGVSRTPVREAIHALQDGGWLTVVPRKGAIVSFLSRADVEEMLQMRLMTESFGFDCAAGKIGVAEMAYLDSLLIRQTRAAEVRDAFDFIESDMQMHLAFVRMMRNRRLFDFAKNFCDHFQCMGIRTLASRPEGFDWSIKSHRIMIEALKEGDAARAKAELVEHLSNTRSVLMNYIEGE